MPRVAVSNDRISFTGVAGRLLRKLAAPGGLASFRTVMSLDREAAMSLGLVLEQQAAARPQGLALRYRERRWTWAEFNVTANRYAALFAAEGIRHGEVIALNMGNRPEALAVVCAAAKLGAITAMINTSQTGEVLAHSLSLVEPRLVVVGEEQLEAHASLPAAQHEKLCGRLLFGAEAPATAAPAGFRCLRRLSGSYPGENPATTAQVRLSDACFYIFTSGTTGLPKASVMSHYRWYRSALSMARLTLDLTPDDVFYCCLPFYHNNALTLGLGAVMVSGAGLAIGAKFSASRFWDEIRSYDASAFCYIGEILRYLLNQPPRPDDRQHRVRAILGNGLRPEIWDGFKARFGIARIHEFYASSEGPNGFVNFFNFDKTCGFSPGGWALVAYDVDADAPMRDARGRMRKLRRGDEGLLLIEVSDKSPFDGYTRREDSEKKLLRDVFRKGDCWFNTGDLMRAQGWGHVQFVDRVGDTFRWQGENVATTEVEAAAGQWPQLEDAVVYGVQLPGRDGRCGMLSGTLRAGETLDAAGFAAHLRARLPRYAVPRFLRLRPAQELTGTFKHRKAELKKQGYDPAAIAEPLWFLGAEEPAWRPMTPALKRNIDQGHERV